MLVHKAKYKGTCKHLQGEKMDIMNIFSHWMKVNLLKHRGIQKVNDYPEPTGGSQDIGPEGLAGCTVHSDVEQVFAKLGQVYEFPH